jgi:hypothetical protein
VNFSHPTLLLMCFYSFSFFTWLYQLTLIQAYVHMFTIDCIVYRFWTVHCDIPVCNKNQKNVKFLL